MGHIVTTIIPIFSLVAVGGIARHWGFMSPEFMGPANRIVYDLAISATILFSAVRSHGDESFRVIILLRQLGSS